LAGPTPPVTTCQWGLGVIILGFPSSPGALCCFPDFLNRTRVFKIPPPPPVTFSPRVPQVVHRRPKNLLLPPFPLTFFSPIVFCTPLIRHNLGTRTTPWTVRNEFFLLFSLQSVGFCPPPNTPVCVGSNPFGALLESEFLTPPFDSVFSGLLPGPVDDVIRFLLACLCTFPFPLVWRATDGCSPFFPPIASSSPVSLSSAPRPRLFC